MTTYLKLIFFISIGAVVYNYLIYPIFILLLNALRSQIKEQLKAADELPTVHILFAAYNEEQVIREKIESSFNCDYPSDKILLTVGSDCSTDQTEAIIKELQQKYPNLQLQSFSQRQGKASIINKLVNQSKADFLILTDANIMFTASTIRQLVTEIVQDENIAAVGGNIEYKQVFDQGISAQENFYLRLENSVKNAESRIFGMTMGLEGGCYIIRREFFPQIPPMFYMEDFFVSMSVLEKNKAVKFNDQAVCYEDVSVENTQEYRRKTRISIGNFQNLGRFGHLIFLKFFPLGFIFLSHKVLRWFTPVFLCLIFISSILLSSHHYIFQIFTGLYFIFLATGLFGILFAQSKRATWIKYPGHFIYMNIALLVGMFIYFKGVKTSVWQPTTRNQK